MRGSLKSLLVLAAVGMLALVSCAVDVVAQAKDSAVARMRAAGDWLVRQFDGFAVDAGCLAEKRSEPTDAPIVAVVRAVAYHLRQVKREQPQVHPSWRLVPSV